MAMKRFLRLPGVAVLLYCSAGLCAESQSYAIPVTVNGKPILSSEVREAIRSQEQLLRMQISDPNVAEARILQVRAGALYSLMEEQLVLSEFEQSRGVIKPRYVDDDINAFIRQRFGGDRARFLRELAAASMTYSGFKEQRQRMLIVGSLRHNKVKDLPPPTPAQVEAWYRKHAAEFRGEDSIKFSTITIPKHAADETRSGTEAQRMLAEDIRAKINTGAKFAEMARAYSTDAYAGVGGARGLQQRSSLSKAVGDVAFSLKEGTVSDVVDLGQNYLIVLCESRQFGRQAPLVEVRSEVEKRVSAEMARDTMNRWLSSLAARAVIQPESMRSSFLDWLGAQQPGAVE